MDARSYGRSREIVDSIQQLVVNAETETEYRKALIAFAAADNPRFVDLQHLVHPSHMLPQELLPGARSVISFFLPFAAWVVEANARERSQVARERNSHGNNASQDKRSI
jgi:epoxyqueuosine reductase QueG